MGTLLAIIALVLLYNLSKRVEALEKRSSTTSVTDAPARILTPVEQAALNASSGAEKAVFTPARIEEIRREMDIPTHENPDFLARFFAWVKIDFMMKLGAFLLLCALGWFVSYAFMNDWIGPMGRIALGFITGTCFIVLGYWRIHTFPHQGGIFTVLGSTTILLTVYAGRELYDFFTPLSALSIMFLTTAFVALIAVRFSSERLALSGLVLASIAPLFTSDPTPDVVEKFAYLLVVVVGSLWVVYLRGWSTLTLGALVVVFLHGIPYLGSFIASGDRDVVLLFAFVYTGIFFVANILGLICNESEENRTPHLLIAGGTGLYLIAWILAVAPSEWQSLLFAAWMLVFSVGSYIVYRVIDRPEPFYLYGATSIALLGAATACELTGPALTIAYTIEIGVLVFGATHIVGDRRVASALTFLFFLPILLSLESMGSYDWRLGVLHDSFFVLLILMLTLGAIGLLAYEHETKKGEPHSGSTGALLMIAGCYLVVLIWLVFHAGDTLTESTATLFALFVYAVAGIMSYTKGRNMENATLRGIGIVLIALVMARLLLVDVWNMELAGRIVTFGVIGLLFLSTAFLKKRLESGITETQQ